MREHVVAGEHDLGRGVVVDEVAEGMAGGVHCPQRPRAQVQVGTVGHPAVGVLPVGEHGAVPLQRGQVADQLRRPQPAQALRPEDAVAAGAVEHLPGRQHVGALVLAERDQRAELAPQLDREGVVVDVDVGDEEVADVAEPVAELSQRLGEPFPGRDHRHPRVDQVDAPGVGDRVDVDGLQPVQRQRQRDPVDAPAEVLDRGFDPGVAARRCMAHRVADPSLRTQDPASPELLPVNDTGGSRRLPARPVGRRPDSGPGRELAVGLGQRQQRSLYG